MKLDDVKVQKLLRDVKELNDKREEKIQVEKCMLSSKKYQLILDKQFDYEGPVELPRGSDR